MKKYKIGILVDQLVPGGVQKSAIQEAQYLKKLGHDVRLFVLVRLDISYQYQDLSTGLEVIYLSDFNPWPFKRAWRIPYFSFLTTLHLLNPFFAGRYQILKNLDFIVSHGTTTCITARAVSLRLKIPYLAFIWDPMLYIWEKVYGSSPIRWLSPFIKSLIKKYERDFLLTAALVATSSRVHQKFIKTHYQIDPLIIYPGCAILDIAPRKQSRYILGFTRWESAKNPFLFMTLARKIPRLKILLAGSWTNIEDRADFLAQVKAQGLAKRISLLSAQAETDLQEIAQKSFVWVHPNFEAFGMSGLEMAAYGLPIIIPRGSGVTELFTHGREGFFPDDGKTNQFVKYIKYLYQHPTEALTMGKKAAATARKYSWETHAQTVLKSISVYLTQTKIVCLANAFVSTQAIGGGDQVLMQTIKHLSAKVRITVILPQHGLYHWQKVHIASPYLRFVILPTTWFDNQDRPFRLFIAYLIRSFLAYFYLLKLPSFDILHTSTDMISDTLPAFLYHQTNIQPWTARFFHFIQTPFQREGQWWINTGSYFLQQLSLLLLKQADLLLVDNPTLIPKLTKKGFSRKNIRLAFGGVDLDQIKATPIYRKLSSDAIVIGRLQPHKGIFDALDVWQKVTRVLPQARLVIVGYATREIQTQVQRQVKLTGLEKNVFFTGYLKSQINLYQYIKASKLLLFLDHEAGFGLVVAEAMAAGLPVICYDLSIFGSVYKQGFMALPLKQPDLVAKKVINLLTQESIRQRLAKTALTESYRFDWQKIGRKFEIEVCKITKFT